jgi:hypothetical protein
MDSVFGAGLAAGFAVAGASLSVLSDFSALAGSAVDGEVGVCAVLCPQYKAMAAQRMRSLGEVTGVPVSVVGADFGKGDCHFWQQREYYLGDGTKRKKNVTNDSCLA